MTHHFLSRPTGRKEAIPDLKLEHRLLTWMYSRVGEHLDREDESKAEATRRTRIASQASDSNAQMHIKISKPARSAGRRREVRDATRRSDYGAWRGVLARVRHVHPLLLELDSDGDNATPSRLKLESRAHLPDHVYTSARPTLGKPRRRQQPGTASKKRKENKESTKAKAVQEESFWGESKGASVEIDGMATRRVSERGAIYTPYGALEPQNTKDEKKIRWEPQTQASIGTPHNKARYRKQSEILIASPPSRALDVPPRAREIHPGVSAGPDSIREQYHRRLLPGITLHPTLEMGGRARAVSYIPAATGLYSAPLDAEHYNLDWAHPEPPRLPPAGSYSPIYPPRRRCRAATRISQRGSRFGRVPNSLHTSEEQNKKSQECIEKKHDGRHKKCSASRSTPRWSPQTPPHLRAIVAAPYSPAPSLKPSRTCTSASARRSTLASDLEKKQHRSLHAHRQGGAHSFALIPPPLRAARTAYVPPFPCSRCRAPCALAGLSPASVSACNVWARVNVDGIFFSIASSSRAPAACPQRSLASLLRIGRYAQAPPCTFSPTCAAPHTPAPCPKRSHLLPHATPKPSRAPSALHARLAPTAKYPARPSLGSPFRRLSCSSGCTRAPTAVAPAACICSTAAVRPPSIAYGAPLDLTELEALRMAPGITVFSSCVTRSLAPRRARHRAHGSAHLPTSARLTMLVAREETREKGGNERQVETKTHLM
ncbi:hypothetical protein K438DRAFT_1938056 [Mycena galopus ATCC 62051]|nr:hypothetical protein K438DRAFT_1938056 [Mycena galopus ATCC 62051]